MITAISYSKLTLRMIFCLNWHFKIREIVDCVTNKLVCILTAEEMERAVGDLGPDHWENGVQVSICFALFLVSVSL